jgi:phage tail sheath gpL-like
MAIPNLLNINFLLPGVAHKIDPSFAIRGLRGMPRRLLLVGQVATNAAIAEDTITGISTEANAVDLLGEGSMLLAMWRAAFKNASLGLPIDVVASHGDATATAATGTLTLSGTVIKNGALSLYIAGHLVRIGVRKGHDINVLASDLNDLINARGELPVTSSVAAGVLTLTSKWKGETANEIDLRVNYYDSEETPAGLAVALIAMAGGTVNPNVSSLITALANSRYTEIINPYTDAANMALWEAEQEKRWGFEDMRDGQVCIAVRGTEGELVAFAANRNSAQVHTIASKNDLTSPWELAAMAGAALESASAVDPAEPFTGIKLNGYLPSRGEDAFKPTQRNILMQNGLSPVLVANGRGYIDRMVTNYRRTEQGAADTSLRNLNWIKTLSYYRWFVTTEFQVKYKGYKLAEYVVEPIPGQKIMTRELGEDVMKGIYELMMDAGLMQNFEHYKATLVVEVDGANGRLKIVDQPVLITQHYQTEITSKYAAGHV